jgi:hypothetical protein
MQESPCFSCGENVKRAALRNAKQYADAEAATKDFVLG